MKQNHDREMLYLKKNIPMNRWDKAYKDDFFEKINKLIPSKENINYKQHEFLKEANETMLQIDNALTILKEYNLEYEISLVGGAVRDFIMNKTEQVNDFDVVLRFPNVENYYLSNKAIEEDSILMNEEQYTTKNIKFKQMFKKYMDTNIQDITVRSLILLIQKIMSSNNFENKLFLNENNKTENYINNHICGILKMEKMGINRKIDLIIIKNNEHDFVNTFNFDLCKGYINYTNMISSNKNNDHLNLLDNIILTKNMVSDIINKKMTMNLQNLTEEHLHYYMNKHYIKMKNKYSDCKLTYRINKVIVDDKIQLEKLTNIEKIAQYYIIKEQLNKENEEKCINDLPVNKIKI